ncbi:MAG: pyridoxamine 5'-phosphate oxidase family protein [Armatimonadota bacterium]|nr:pyridoxamine 5'-phosphate oxidase family protein [Armatimonadota bacterium]
MSQDEGATENSKKFTGWIEGIRIAMLTTTGSDGSLWSRPMATQDADFDGTLWFFTHGSSPKVKELAAHPQVSVSYSSPEDNRYVSASGRAEVVHDRKKAEELWNPILKAWFPDGLEDPDLALLKVDLDEAEYWSGPSNVAARIAGFAKALVTGATYPGENEKVDL